MKPTPEQIDAASAKFRNLIAEIRKVAYQQRKKGQRNGPAYLEDIALRIQCIIEYELDAPEGVSE
jgi:hypothetical protein